MTVKGGTSQACAACKYQRRKCAPDCALAPYFPADKPKMFQNAHRLFGVCNIMKILKQIRDDQKDEAMKSIIYESDMRQRFPIFGCSLVIWQLREQLRQLQEELLYVNSWLSILRNKEHNCNGTQQVPDLSQQFETQFHLGLGPNGAHPYQPSTELGLPSTQILVGDKDVGYVESSEVKPFWIQQHQQQQQTNGFYMNGLSNNNGSLEMKPFMVAQGVPIQQEIEVFHDYDDIPFDTIADDRQSYIESKDVCESSDESTLKDTIQSMDTLSQNHELKSAAACFSLTNVN